MTAFIERLKTGVPEVLSELFQSVSRSPLLLENAAKSIRQAHLPYASISLDALVREVGPLSLGSVLVGACDDQLHFYMDLYDPRPGSVLIAGEHQAGQSRLLTTILSSAVLYNPPRYFRYAYLSDKPAYSSSLTMVPHCFRVVSNSTPGAGQLIAQLADLAESRVNQAQADALVILAIDNLDTLCTSLDDRTYDDLAWLLQNGPSVRIWTFATLDIRRVDVIGTEVLDLFGTHLLGAMNAKNAITFNVDATITNSLIPEKQFCIWFDNQWLSFWVPEPAS